MWGVAVKQRKRASACPTGRNRGSLSKCLFQAFQPPSYSSVPRTKGERSIITSHLSFLQLRGNKQLVCEFDPHIPGWKKNLNFSASWWCITLQMNRKIGRKVGRKVATLFYVYTTAHVEHQLMILLLQPACSHDSRELVLLAQQGQGKRACQRGTQRPGRLAVDIGEKFDG